jgi:hypothetical protein
MTAFVFANNVNTTLAAPITASATSLVLTSTANLPTLATGQVMPLTLNDAATRMVYEIVYVTAINGSTLTVTRGQEGTTAVSWMVGDYAACMNTAGTTASMNGSALQRFNVAQAINPTDALQLQQVYHAYDLMGGFGGLQSAASEVVMLYVSTRTIYFADNFAGSTSFPPTPESVGTALAAATASTVFTITVNGTSVGTITYPAGGSTPTFAGAALTVKPGQVVQVTGPATADTTLASVSFTLAGATL